MPERGPETDPALLAMGGVLRLLWALRVELTLLGSTAALWAAVAERVGATVAGALTALPWVVAVAVGPSRRFLRRLLYRASVRRQFARAVRTAEISRSRASVPRVVEVCEVPAGDTLTVTVPLGGTVGDLEDAAETMAATLAVRDVRVVRDPANARRGRVVIVRRDPLANTQALVWPNTAAGRLSLWSPVPVGVGDDGDVVTIHLPERNLLLGGEPGAGKSGALSLAVATAALDPSVRLWLLDGKLVELATWAGCAEHSVGVSVAEAVDVLRSLQADMELRYAQLLASRRRKVAEGDGLPLHVVVCDELAHYLTAGDRKERAEFADVARDLVSRGRAAGIIMLAATQKPSSDIIPTALRDLFGFRWALRCSTPQASDTILGSGWASAGFSAAEVDAGCRGVGYLLHEGGQPVRLRSFWLDDDTLAALSARAEGLRRAQEEGEPS